MQNRITLIAALILISCAFAFSADMVVNNGYDPGAMRTDGTNADSPVFPGAVTVTGQFTAADGAEFNGTASAVKILGNPTGPTENIDGKGGIDVWNNYVLVGSDLTANTRTNATSKYFIFLIAHRNTSNRPFAFMSANALQSANNLNLGYGGTTWTGATSIAFWTSVNNTTTTDSEAMRINSSQQLLIATTTAAVDSAVKLKLDGGMEIASGGFAVIGSDTRQAGYALTVGGTASDSIYCGGDVNALSFTDRSDAPADLAEAYAIIQSHEAKDGKVDHSKLHAAAWGKKFRVVATGKTLTKTREIAPAEEGGKATIEEYSEPEKVVISEPDQQGRNLSMVISAQALVIADLTRRLEALEARERYHPLRGDSGRGTK